MAARRVAKSAVDWAKFASLVPAEEAGVLAGVKGKQDGYVTKVGSLPESLPQLDFAKYKTAVPAFATTIDSFAKSYAAVSVPYPGDQGKLAEVDAASAKQVAENEQWIKDSVTRVQGYKQELKTWEVVPPLEHMMEEEWNYYFPGTIKDSKIEGHYLELVDESGHDYRLYDEGYQRDYEVKLAPWQQH